MRITKDIMKDIVIEHFKSYFVGTWGFSVEEFGAFAKANIYMLTVTPGFDNKDAVTRHYRIQHHAFSRALLGKDPSWRNAQFQMMGYAFLDFKGTRKGLKPDQEVLPHIHAIMMIHPATRDRFDAIPKGGTIFDGARLYDPSNGHLNELVTYVMKGVVGEQGFTSADENGCGWEVYPRITARTSEAYKRQVRS